MERLTEYHCNVAVIKDKSKLSEAMAKLAHYEDLEDSLFKVYGECEGLIDKAVEGIASVHLGTCRKATLLTNEDADKWEHLKDLEEQGLLLRLPCKVGDVVYKINKASKKIESYIVIKFDIEKSDTNTFTMQIWFDNYTYCFFSHFGKTVFPTKAEAEEALKKMESERGTK